MLSPVTTSDPRQDALSLLVQQQKQKQQDELRAVRNNQPSTQNAQLTNVSTQNQAHLENQNSQPAKGASLDVRA